MGVPKFYRWLSERYPCLSETVHSHSIPAFDNFYLDMNGIIHPCSHPNSDDPHFRIDEEQIFSNIFRYIEFLFRMIRPRKLLFLAVDGVAPRAKMNQQRARRFRTAKEAESAAKRARDRGEQLPDQPAFDSNSITPGTPFMARLHKQLQYFITSKVSTDALWQNVRVVLSGHDVPGEGEHKVMDYIRYAKSKPDYDPNVRHCLYGLDADLIMLGLCTHDPHFSLLREEVKFGGKDRRDKKGSTTVNPETTTFHLLHLSLLREYIDLEFGAALKARLSFDYDLERIVDDWILMGFLVGNDFIPHLPNLHINKGALSELYDAYKETMPKLDGYISSDGILNLSRLSVFLRCLSEKELNRFDDIYSDAKWLEGKKATVKKSKKGFNQHSIEDTPGPAHVVSLLDNLQDDSETMDESRRGLKKDSALARLLNSADEFIDDSSSPDEELNEKESTLECRGDDSYAMEFRQFKRQYYITNMGYPTVDEAVLREQAETFIRALQWNLHYYYHGCVSWSWFYPHHYAPFITDVAEYADQVNLNFDLGRPFSPFEQLLAVLPAASKNLLPLPLQDLMTSQTSPVIDFYPIEFKTDLNGKQQDWEAVVLIPFIDENRLVDAMKPWLNNLTPDEKKRNSHGCVHIFTYTTEDLGRYESPGHFPPIAMNHSLEEQIDRDAWQVARSALRHGLMDGVRLDVFFPGFPTLKHLKYSSKLVEAKVKVFQQESRGLNMVLTLKNDHKKCLKLEDLARQLHNKEVWINWPHLREAKVVSVCDSKRYIDQDGQEGNMTFGDFKNAEEAIAEKYKSRWGVVIGKTNYIVYVQRMTGRKYMYTSGSEVTLSKQWSRNSEPVALQALVQDISVEDASFSKFLSLEQVFKLESKCYVLSKKDQFYGCEAVVKGVDESGYVIVDIKQQVEPNLSEVQRAERDSSLDYFSVGKTARLTGLSPNALSRITGSVLVAKNGLSEDPEQRSKVNIGLNVKFNRRNEEIWGYSRRLPSTQQWLYSSKTIELLLEYGSKFPEIFAFVNNSRHSDVHPVYDVFHTCHDPLKRLTDLSAWLKQLPSAQVPKTPCGLKALDDDIVKHLERVVDEFETKRTGKTLKNVRMKFKPENLFKPQLELQNAVVDERCSFFNLFDRVVNVREGHAVPLGLRGTVISVAPAASSEEMTQIEVLFDKSFPGGVSLRGSSNNRAAKLPATALISITFGITRNNSRKNVNSRSDAAEFDNTNKPFAVVHPQHHVVSYSKAAAGGSQKKTSKMPPDPKRLPPPPISLLGRKEQTGTKPAESEEQMLSRELKAMLKIEGEQTSTRPYTAPQVRPKMPLPQQRMTLPFGPPVPPVRPQGHVNQLHALAVANRWAPPIFNFRHEGISPQGSPLISAQLVLDEGRNFYSPYPCGSDEQAAESVAQVALQHLSPNWAQPLMPQRPLLPAPPFSLQQMLNRPRGMAPFGATPRTRVRQPPPNMVVRQLLTRENSVNTGKRTNQPQKKEIADRSKGAIAKQDVSKDKTKGASKDALKSNAARKDDSKEATETRAKRKDSPKKSKNTVSLSSASQVLEAALDEVATAQTSAKRKLSKNKKSNKNSVDQSKDNKGDHKEPSGLGDTVKDEKLNKAATDIKVSRSVEEASAGSGQMSKDNSKSSKKRKPKRLAANFAIAKSDGMEEAKAN